MSNTPPYIVIPAKTARSVFCFCDHATNHVPEPFENLGLSMADTDRHIAWDIGAEALTRHFCQAFGTGGILAQFSRLLIDPNRGLGSDGLIPHNSDGTAIPANQNLTDAQVKDRIDTYYEPYHMQLAAELDTLEGQAKDPLIISIHSFTPKPQTGAERQLDIGLLWKVDRSNAERVKEAIENVHPYAVGLNQPYSALKLNHTMDRHVIPRGLRHITFEVRQDLIDTDTKVQLMGDRLSAALQKFITA